MEWKSSLPLLVAAVSAALAAYFAIVRTKRERLWLDRYETLNSLISNLEVLSTKFAHDEAEEVGLSVAPSQAISIVHENWAKSHRAIQQDRVRLRLLFREPIIRDLAERLQEIEGALFDLYQEIGPPREESGGYYTEPLRAVSDAADAATDVAVLIAYDHLLEKEGLRKVLSRFSGGFRDKPKQELDD